MNVKTAKRYFVFGIGLFGCACAAFSQSGSAHGTTLSCGLGLPPDAPGFAKAQEQIALEARKNGYQAVCDADLERFRITFEPARKIMASLPFAPVNLSGTPFASFKELGAMTERSNGLRSRLYRGYRMPDGHALTLFEHDMSVDGVNAWRDPADEPERINGLPARLVVMQTPEGAAVSHLSWTERRRAYEFWINANVTNSPLRDQLFALAASLPLSRPGCPNEVPPEPVRLGANGLPELAPPPLTLPADGTGEASAAMKRPCK